MELIKEVLYQTYQFLASIKVPGFDISFIQLFFGIIAIPIISIGFAKIFFGLGDTSIFHFSSLRQRGGNSKKIKTSKERQGDTK